MKNGCVDWNRPGALRNVPAACKGQRPTALYVAFPVLSAPVMDRLATFRSFIQKSPADPFPRYGLAMELKGRGLLDEAALAFTELMTQFPDYVAAYLQAGNVEVGRGKRTEAAEIFRKGIEVAQRRGDAHARGELESALAELAPA